MKQDSIFDSADHITENAVDDSATKLIPPDSILCVTRSGILAHTFPVAITMVPVTVNQDIKALTPSKGIDPRYLAWALRAEGREILETCSKDGTTVNSIESSRLYAHRVPVAPQREQLRIVAKIEKLFSELDNGIESLKIAREQTNIYRQSVLKQAFEGKLTAHWRTEANTEEIRSAPTIECSPSLPQSTAEIHTLPSLPSTWHWSKLGDVADITGGLTKNPARNHFPRRVKYLRVANVYADSLNLAEIHEIGVTGAELNRVLLQHGDLLIVEGNGSIDQIGRVAAWASPKTKLYAYRIIRTASLTFSSSRGRTINLRAIRCPLSGSQKPTRKTTTAGTIFHGTCWAA
jgi:type I restriction enzyme S subunit